MLHDLQFAIRTLRHNPLISGVAVLTLALGIGAATAVFSVADAVLLRPLPFHDPDRLVRIHAVTPEGSAASFSDAAYLDLAAAARTLEGAAAFREVGTSHVLSGDGDPERIIAVPVSASAGSVLGVHPAAGRMFTPDEDRRGAEGRVVLGHALWQRRFGGDRAVLGRLVLLDDRPFVVTGVMPPGFDFPDGADAWIPLAASADRARDDHELAVFGRLAPGATLEEARAELRRFGQQLSAAHPQVSTGWSADALPFSEWFVSPRFREAVWVLLGAVAILILLACANVASLLVAHGTTRQGELRIRAALGADRLRLVRQLFTEAALLALLGTGAGVLVASWSVDALQALGGARVPRLDEVRVNGAVLGFACLAGVASCLLFGIAPAVRGSRLALRQTMDEGTRFTAGGRRLRHGLVVVEVALALLLLVGASLLASSFIRLLQVDPGFDADGALALSIDLPAGRYPEQRVSQFYGALLDRMRAVPGVTAVGATSTNPFREFGFSNDVTPADRAHEAPPSGLMQAGWRSVTPGLFEALRVPIVGGRAFGPEDDARSERVVMVSRSLAGRLWPGEEPVGKRIYWGGTTGRTRSVIGITGDIRDVRLDTDASPMLFVPHAQAELPAMTVIVRTSLPAASIAPALRQAVRDLDAGLPPPEVNEVRTNRAEASAAPRFNLWLLGTFAGVALALALTGVYATLAFTIAERRREIAVRLALGASPGGVLRLVLRSGLAFALAGIVAGTAAALGTTTMLGSLLFEVGPTDPWSFGAAVVVLMATSAVACYLPARRAARLEPAAILRE